ncbi:MULTISPECIES: hypothetical protein [Mesorhizobium]|uniref:Uncharacterized protein n=1 Tax=Mesorhizobium abyssinicae TaxID=1209958 RepID=A0ABU5ASD5_9HYPH|nr:MULTISPECIES: hypothetical protein [Mesorhizobium]RVC61033.1 hypothetical protein EN779_11700 [Mesorhizobium sp. M4B.F.Ca.ET.088.02.2.1]MDX8540122.1 hypothetical protein [Mesorhizobium abyssinicae]RUW71367.1 hypothetical protein EOA31_18030 [Mesorhizobium sp. M4B.F.Ca.ET.049.02.1.2]RVD14171.1 hypothetical protein EN738_33270 [Mesorhizobium sp. M4B.F.Ca.ET.017.02.2.1]RWA62057.1 MAG: hypothetical protein EOQ27_15320 [Mesorhizobium sp.]
MALNFSGASDDAFKCIDAVKEHDNHLRSFPSLPAQPAGPLACLLTLSSQWCSQNETKAGFRRREGSP